MEQFYQSQPNILTKIINKKTFPKIGLDFFQTSILDSLWKKKINRQRYLLNTKQTKNKTKNQKKKKFKITTKNALCWIAN